jgi:hypothetical protein
VDGARAAAERGELGDWVARFLRSPGSDNAVLAEALNEPHRSWLGPLRLPIGHLHRLAGPPDDPVLCSLDEDDWGDDVDEMEQRVEEGWVPPPLVVTYREGDLVLEDGNHRAEAVRRTGADEVWAVVAFDRAEERDRFTVPEDADAG